MIVGWGYDEDAPQISSTGQLSQMITYDEEVELPPKLPFGFQASDPIGQIKCGTCDSWDTGWSIETGYFCRACGGTDADA